VAHQNQTNLDVVVNGQPTVVKGNVDAPLRSVIEKALEQTGNTGQPPDNWEFRDAAGTLLSDSEKIGDFIGVKLFLNLKAGVGG
jgi:Protein of Unknown function (DUF2604)